MDDREKLRDRFNRSFSHWDPELPMDAVKPGVASLIVRRGWIIWTKFEAQAEDDLPHLDYYAMHRMTNDRHVRLYADGDTNCLPTIVSYMIHPADATNAEVKALDEERASRKQAVEELLEAKGFVMTADAHPSAPVNRHLAMHSERQDPDPD
ncbi:MAG: hypothetical protein OXG16_04390 [Rhodospirillales bacterium]|nr:hypothetical protein [Rhodospirillales bacterium]